MITKKNSCGSKIPHLHNFSNGPSLNLMDLSMESALGCLPFTKSSRKSGWKGSGTRLFGSFELRISESNETSGKVVLFSRSQCSKRKFVFHFIKNYLSISGFLVCFSVNGTDLCNDERDSGDKFTSPEFYLPFTKRQTDLFLNVNAW